MYECELKLGQTIYGMYACNFQYENFTFLNISNFKSYACSKGWERVRNFNDIDQIFRLIIPAVQHPHNVRMAFLGLGFLGFAVVEFLSFMYSSIYFI